MNKTTKIDNKMYYDVMDEIEEWATDKFTETPEGFLTGRAIATNIGVFTYTDTMGNTIRELRPPEEVFEYNSRSSLKLKPVTNEHPIIKLTADNIKEYQVGFCGDSVYSDPYTLSVPITITDKKTIDEIKAGKRALSCGYEADLDYTPGVWMGVQYDAVQRNIRYNHISVVDKGRAGDLAKIRMDGIDMPVRYQIKDNTKESTSMEMKKLTLDGVEYSAEAKVIETVHKLKQDVADLNKKIEDSAIASTKIEAERDTLKVKFDEAERKVQELEAAKLDSSAIDSIIAERLEVMDSAKEMGAEVTANMSIDEMKKLAIAKVLPKLDMTNKDSIYISAVFDTCKETKILQTTVDNAQNTTQSNTIQKTDSISARESYMQKLKDEYKENGGK